MMSQKNDLVVGRITGVFGIRGELKCDPTNAGRTVFSPGVTLRCARGEGDSAIRIVGVRQHKGRLLIRIEAVDDADAAAAYAGALLYAPRERVALAEGEYLDADLIGCAVVGKDGVVYGSVDRVEHLPSSDMLVLGDRMVPMVSAIVTELDLARRRIVIDPPAGLLD
jgi:16S rRNA processing protein RimM